MEKYFCAQEALDLMNEIRRDRYRGWSPEPSPPSSGEQTRAAVDQIIVDAVAAEREACAEIAVTPLQVGAESFRPKTAEEIVILIRARGNR